MGSGNPRGAVELQKLGVSFYNNSLVFSFIFNLIIHIFAKTFKCGCVKRRVQPLPTPSPQVSVCSFPDFPGRSQTQTLIHHTQHHSTLLGVLDFLSASHRGSSLSPGAQPLWLVPRSQISYDQPLPTHHRPTIPDPVLSSVTLSSHIPSCSWRLVSSSKNHA